MSDLGAKCSSRFSPGGTRCERNAGHSGMHEASNRTLRWGGRYGNLTPAVKIRPAKTGPPRPGASKPTAAKFRDIPDQESLWDDE